MQRRLWKEVYRDSRGGLIELARRTYFTYVDEGLVAEAAQYISIESSEMVTATQGVVDSVRYALRPDAPFTTGALFSSVVNSGNQNAYLYQHRDQMEVPVLYTNGSASELRSIDYEPFGRASIKSISSYAPSVSEGTNLRFSGQYWDEEIEASYNLFRHYDVSTGRYQSKDPIGLRGNLNEYIFASANPLLFGDPLGLVAVYMEGYTPFGGGGFMFGWDRHGVPFLTVRMGFGLGVGVGVDLSPEITGYKKPICDSRNNERPIGGMTAGVFAGASVKAFKVASYTPLDWHAGWGENEYSTLLGDFMPGFRRKEPYPYSTPFEINPTPKVELPDDASGLKALISMGVSAGAEISMFGPGVGCGCAPHSP
jgi:RHS repeat-associated protein